MSQKRSKMVGEKKTERTKTDEKRNDSTPK